MLPREPALHSFAKAAAERVRVAPQSRQSNLTLAPNRTTSATVRMDLVDTSSRYSTENDSGTWLQLLMSAFRPQNVRRTGANQQ